ncbi:hypothetical protein Sjap_006427 [Stephania japonica]|uniref:Uncharacterized protein n=1 Tax=Stephania japonica TaxID=461633 RepID=A0AAP0K7I3_9MAGN
MTSVASIWYQRKLIQVDLIFFEEDSENLDEGPKFDNDGHDFVENKVVFGDDNFFVEVVYRKNTQVLEMVIGDTVVNKSSLKNFSNYDKVDAIFFEDDSDNLDEGPKFNNDGHNLVEDKVVFGDDGFVVEVVYRKNPQVLEMAIGDTVENVDTIFFEEDSDNLNEGPKFDDDGHDFVEDKVTMQLRVKFACCEEPEEQYSDEEEFVSEKKIDSFFFLYDDDKVDLIFFKEDSENLDKGPKFEDGHDFVEDKVVFGDDDFIIEVVSNKNPQGENDADVVYSDDSYHETVVFYGRDVF